MLPFEDRYTRQRQLREVGLKGQLQIAALVARLPGDKVGEVAALYLKRAGAQVETLDAEAVRTAPPPANAAVAFPYAEEFRFQAARELAAGCHLALALIRKQLNLQTEQR
jgi:hypothetical protein